MPREDLGAPLLSEKYVKKTLEEEDVFPISNMENLTFLDLSNLPKITDVGIKVTRWVHKFLKVYVLPISGMVHILVPRTM